MYFISQSDHKRLW